MIHDPWSKGWGERDRRKGSVNEITSPACDPLDLLLHLVQNVLTPLKVSPCRWDESSFEDGKTKVTMVRKVETKEGLSFWEPRSRELLTELISDLSIIHSKTLSNLKTAQKIGAFECRIRMRNRTDREVQAPSQTPRGGDLHVARDPPTANFLKLQLPFLTSPSNFLLLLLQSSVWEENISLSLSCAHHALSFHGLYLSHLPHPLSPLNSLSSKSPS